MDIYMARANDNATPSPEERLLRCILYTLYFIL